MVWGEKGMGLNERYVKETRKFGGGSIMVWGCIVTTLTSLTQVATKGKGLRARRENKQVGKA
jgi:hypothetical protein